MTAFHSIEVAKQEDGAHPISFVFRIGVLAVSIQGEVNG